MFERKMMLFWNPRFVLPVPQRAYELENKRSAKKCITEFVVFGNLCV